MLVGCLLIPDFPAWALQRHQQQENTPLAVIERAEVISVSPEARSLRVRPGLSSEEMRSNWPDVHLITRRPHVEKHAWEGVLRQLYTFTPRIEPETAGHAFFRPVDGSDLRGLARHLKATITVTTHREHALCAAYTTEPGNLSILYADQLGDFRASTPSSILRGLAFSDELCERLEQFGLRTLKQVAHLTERHLTAQFGEEGARLYALLHPPENSPPIPNFRLPELLTRTYDLEHPHAAAREIPQAVHHLMCELLQDLGTRAAQRLTLRLDATPEYPPAIRLLREPADQRSVLKRHLDTLLQSTDLSSLNRVDSASLELGHLSQPATEQAPLFNEKPALQKALQGILKQFPGQLLHADIHPHALFEEERVSMRPLTPR